MAPASVRPIATCRFSGPTRSLVRLSATGKTPPEPMPARIRDGEQHRKRSRERAENVGKSQQHQANHHQPRLAEQIGGRAQYRLYDGEGERERRREACRGRDGDAEILGDMRQHRIQRAGRQGGGKGRERNDVDYRGNTLVVRRCSLP